MSTEAIGLDGKRYPWNLAKYRVGHTDTRKRSSLHIRARLLLQSLFPCDIILEEVALPGTRLQADFYLHSHGLMVEVQGEQHYKFNSFHFKNRADFRVAKTRDRQKVEWCDINGITLVELPFNETDDEWKNRINKRMD